MEMSRPPARGPQSSTFPHQGPVLRGHRVGSVATQGLRGSSWFTHPQGQRGG